jgi:SAM-dependent methyltransferase
MAIERRRGRRLFGRDPAAFDRVRPGYPAALYRVLERRCGLGPGAAVFEIGAGSGKATRELLGRKVRRLTIVEPDPRFVRFLRANLRRPRGVVEFLPRAFEDATLAPGTYDLGVAATSFHWLRERSSLRKIARTLRPGGWWASFMNFSNDSKRPSALYRAVRPLWNSLPGERRSRVSPRRREQRFQRARLDALRASGMFDRLRVEEFRSERTLDTATLVGLYGTFSEVSTLPAPVRDRFLRDVAELIDRRFHGRVRIPTRTTLYTARRRPAGHRAARRRATDHRSARSRRS